MNPDGFTSIDERELSLWVTLVLLLVLIFVLVPDDIAERISG